MPAAATVLASQVACTDALAQISGSTLGTAAEVLGGTIHLVGPLHAHSTVLALVSENGTHRRSRGRISERISRITEFVGEGFAGGVLRVRVVGDACVDIFAVFSLAILAKERFHALTVILGTSIGFVLDLAGCAVLALGSVRGADLLGRGRRNAIRIAVFPNAQRAKEIILAFAFAVGNQGWVLEDTNCPVFALVSAFGAPVLVLARIWNVWGCGVWGWNARGWILVLHFAFCEGFFGCGLGGFLQLALLARARSVAKGTGNPLWALAVVRGDIDVPDHLRGKDALAAVLALVSVLGADADVIGIVDSSVALGAGEFLRTLTEVESRIRQDDADSAVLADFVLLVADRYVLHGIFVR
mmetsp:Transcript_24931/g.58496  ORF Transcript_24931/g.58496 Transcript_24931/m.58496 type:complete len:357 (+) Transcript_24931:1467-2537(+)